MNIAAVVSCFIKIVDIMTLSYFLREKNSFLIRKNVEVTQKHFSNFDRGKTAVFCFVILFTKCSL